MFLSNEAIARADRDAARLAELEAFLAFATVWTWRDNVSDLERVGAIQFHPLVEASKALPGMAVYLDEVNGVVAPALLNALEAYETTVQAHRKVLSEQSADKVSTARQALIDAHKVALRKSVGATDDLRAPAGEGPGRGRSDIRDRVARTIFGALADRSELVLAAFRSDEAIWGEIADEVFEALGPDAIDLPNGTIDAIQSARFRSLADRLMRALQTETNDDASAPGSPERTRYVERCAALLDAADCLRGLSLGRVPDGRSA